jgi:ankyrin repeat protein
LDTGIYHPDRDANKKLLIFTDANSYFIECCSKGLFDMVRELYLTNKVIIHYVYKKAFQISCMNGHVNIVEFLYSVGSYTHYYNYYEEVLNFHYDVFIDVCKKGKLEIAKILDTRKLLVTFNNFDEFFHICCINGHLEFAKWIYSRFRINIHWRNNIVFLSACENGHNSIVEWLLTIIDLDSNSLHRAFTLACKEGHLNTVKLLYSFKNVSFQFNNYEAINNCCYFGHLLILKWIFELKIDFNKIYKIVLDKCCFYNQYNVISWLYQLNKESFLIEIQDNIYYACMTNDVSLIKFLIKFIDKNKIVPICTKFKSYDILDLFD